MNIYHNWHRGLWIAKSSAFSSKTCVKKVEVMTSRGNLMAPHLCVSVELGGVAVVLHIHCHLWLTSS